MKRWTFIVSWSNPVDNINETIQLSRFMVQIKIIDEATEYIVFWSNLVENLYERIEFHRFIIEFGKNINETKECHLSSPMLDYMKRRSWILIIHRAIWSLKTTVGFFIQLFRLNKEVSIENWVRTEKIRVSESFALCFSVAKKSGYQSHGPRRRHSQRPKAPRWRSLIQFPTFKGWGHVPGLTFLDQEFCSKWVYALNVECWCWYIRSLWSLISPFAVRVACAVGML